MLADRSDSVRPIRVSCAALCRIEHVGRFFLLLNRNRRLKGLYVLSPVGGALDFTDFSAAAALGGVPENPLENELRLLLPQDALPAFRDWFYSGEGRERSPFRELHEELVDEARLLPPFAPTDAECTYLRTVEDQSHTERQGQTGLLTQYFLEIYDVRFKRDRLLGPLLAAPPESGALWLSGEEIATGSTLLLEIDGAQREVRINARLVLPGPEGKSS